MSNEKSKNKYGCLYLVLFLFGSVWLFTISPFYEKVENSDHLTNSSSLILMIFFVGIMFIAFKFFVKKDED